MLVQGIRGFPLCRVKGVKKSYTRDLLNQRYIPGMS